MDVNAKYRRWGWGAVIGLIGVILIAGLIVAISLSSSPKPTIGSEPIITTGSTGSDAENGGSASGAGSNGGEANANNGSESGNTANGGTAGGQTDAEKKAAEEKAAQEKAEKEAAEKAAKEKAEKEAAEKAAKEKAEQEAAQKSNNLPHTGPSESFVTVVAFAVIAYLVALNVSLVKKQSA